MQDVNEKQRDPNYGGLVEAGWRRELTPGEKAQVGEVLSRDPGLREDWERERALSRALNRLPAAPVPSNFTARVMQSAEEAARPSSLAGLRARQGFARLLDGMAVPPGLRWLWRGSVAMVLVISGLWSYQHFESAQRERLAQSVATVSGITALPPDILRDFDAIQALNRTPAADEQLLAAMAQ